MDRNNHSKYTTVLSAALPGVTSQPFVLPWAPCPGNLWAQMPANTNICSRPVLNQLQTSIIWPITIKANMYLLYILLTSNLGLVGHTRQFQKPMSSRLIQHWHFLLRPMSSGHNHDIHRNMYEVFKETAPAKTHSRTLCHHCVTRVPGSGI